MKYHMGVDIQGILNLHKNKKITYMTDDNDKPISDKQAREFLKEQLNLGHKVLPIGDPCEGFDYFGTGCQGHEVEEVEN